MAMKFPLFLLLLIHTSLAFPLEIIEVKNAQLQNLYLYNGSRLKVYPEDGVIVTVKGKATRQVKLEITTNGAIYLTPGVRITELKPKNRIITLDKYGEGEFAIGFSLLGEKNVGGKYKKPIKYEVNYVE
jgi:hypothetical protein